MERSFKKEVDALRLGAGETFRGEGILAVTKALLQSGVSYVGGYQGAPASHLLDVMVDAEDLLADLGVHVETCTNEAAAAAMLGASINYPLRGAVTWKSIVGTNVAADALSNLSSPGVIGGALIVLGEDYGEGSSVIQERSYAYAMKSSIWLLDPRPDLPTIVRMVEKGFELSEASHAPVMIDLRVRACHVTGEFIAKEKFPVQSTSIPGVAQRTGATTYHIELVPKAWPASDPRPILALAPGVGDVDLVVASELLEAGRAIAGGFVTPDRTTTIASLSRSYLVVEKMVMADGRYDQQRLIAAVEKNSQKTLLLDLEAIARQSGAMINAVMLGAIARAGALPIPAEAFEAAIRGDGKAVETNLRGFRAGYDAARGGSRPGEAPRKRYRVAAGSLADLEDEVAAMPEAARGFVTEGIRRLTNFQNLAYARLYLDRLAKIRDADEKASAGGRLLAETARHLAVRMSYEDVIRVAQAKIDPARLGRIANDLGIKPNQTFTVTEFLKPGIEEFCSILPPWLAGRILALAERHPSLGRAHWGMAVNTTSVFGYLRFYLLAKLRGLRPKTFRYQEEQRAIEAWLRLIAQAAPLSAELAVEIAEGARLIKGYGDTHKRGTANYRLIENELIRPALAGGMLPREASEAIANARTAALLDPDGEALSNCLAEIQARGSRRIAAE